MTTPAQVAALAIAHIDVLDIDVLAWCPVPGYPGYEVSPDGRVRSWLSNAGGGRLRREPRLLRQRETLNGYLQVTLHRGGQPAFFGVHRLVAMSFIGEPPPGEVVRHRDGNKTDNRLANLQYGTYSDNTLDSVAHGTHVHARKTHCLHGHPFDEANTHVHFRNGRPGRKCRACGAARARAYRAAGRAA